MEATVTAVRRPPLAVLAGLVALLLVGAAVLLVVQLRTGDEGSATSGAGPTPSPAPSPRSCSSVEQHGVTFTFEGPQLCGEFANGDAWVAPDDGQVVISAMTPAAEPGRHGWMVNPSNDDDQGYDDRIGDYEEELVPALPYRASGGESVVKAVSATGDCGNGKGHPPCLQRATVLTVLDEPPPDLGTTVFRPPYYGVDKPLLSTESIRTDLLPSLAPVEKTRSLEQVRDRYAMVQLDHKSNWQGRYLHPADNFRSFDGEDVSNYGSDLASDNNDAALALMLDDPVEDKMPALVNYLQAGIDWYGTVAGGVERKADGGHNVGRKVAVMFAGVLLDDEDIKAAAARTDRNTYSENAQVYVSERTGKPLFGKSCGQGEYEEVLDDGKGARDCRDPLGYIDGGEVPGGIYQKCCTARAFQGSSLVARLLPGGREVWNADYFHDYVDRWVASGAITLPDPQQRFPDRNGANADEGGYGSSFMRAMWRAYTDGPQGTPSDDDA